MRDSLHEKVLEIRTKRDKLSKLKYRKSELLSNHSELDALANYLIKREHAEDVRSEPVTLGSIRKELEKEISRLSGLVTTMKTFNEDATLSDVTMSLHKVTGVNTLNTDIDLLEKEIEMLLKLYNICGACLGKKTVYDRDSAAGDPHARSSDYRMDCGYCKGTGHYVEKPTDKVLT